MHDPGTEMQNVERKHPEEITLVPGNKIEVSELRNLINDYSHIRRGTQVIWKTGNEMKYTVDSDITTNNVRTVIIWRNNRECCGKATSILVKRLTKFKDGVPLNNVQISPTVETTRCCRRVERGCCATFMIASMGGLAYLGYYLIHDRGIGGLV
jgi:hypothetical protein